MATLPLEIKSEVINRPVINIYVNPIEDTELESQVIYGSNVKIIERKNDGWIRIETIDGVHGWIKASDVTANSSYENSEKLRPVKNLFAHVYRVTDTTPFPPLFTLPFGTLVKLEDTKDSGNRWVPIELISGEKAWIQRGDIEFFPKIKSMEEMLQFSKKFIGLPYTWGGTSSFGFDCSGFVQMLFKEMKVSLPRNSKDQALSPLLVTVEGKLQPGDLIFFGETKISHVGLYLGDDQFIHSGPKDIPTIKINDLKSYLQFSNTKIITIKRLLSNGSSTTYP